MTISMQQYRQIRNINKEYAKAMARTNLAIKIWQENGGEIHWLPIMWLLDNHIIQAYYRYHRVDVIPVSIGGMYGYGRNVSIGNRNLAAIATSSSRVEYSDGNPASGVHCFALRKHLSKGGNALYLIDYAVSLAVGTITKRLEPIDADIYLTIHQIITLLVVMGKVGDAILGAVNHENHPLHILNFVPKDMFSYEWFDVDSKIWIHRYTGRLVCGGRIRSWKYSDWCGGSVEKGLSWMLTNVLN